MVFIKLDELQKQLASFFLDFDRDYFFVLSTKDYDSTAEKRLFCMCFNDDESHEDNKANYLIEFLVKRKTDDGNALHLPDGRPGDCKFSDNTYRRIKNLTNHYLEHHPIKLCEFFKHVAFKNSDERMKKSASKILITWYEREQQRLYNAPRFDPNEIQKLRIQARNSSASSSKFSLVRNYQDVSQDDESPHPEVILYEDEEAEIQYNAYAEPDMDNNDDLSCPNDIREQTFELRSNQAPTDSDGIRNRGQLTFEKPSTSKVRLARDGSSSSFKPELISVPKHNKTSHTLSPPIRTSIPQVNRSSESLNRSHQVSQNSPGKNFAKVPSFSSQTAKKMASIPHQPGASQPRFLSIRPAPYTLKKPNQ